MSSNQYGFLCEVSWKGRAYSVQVVYQGTENDSEESLMLATADWETEDPIELAKYELAHREDWESPHAEVRIYVWACYGGWLDDDPSDPTWSPPKPSEREILEAIARGGSQRHRAWVGHLIPRDVDNAAIRRERSSG